MKGSRHPFCLAMALALAGVIVGPGCSSDSPESLSNQVRVPKSPYKHDNAKPGQPPMGGVSGPTGTTAKPGAGSGQ